MVSVSSSRRSWSRGSRGTIPVPWQNITTLDSLPRRVGGSPKGPRTHDQTSAEWQLVLIEQQQKNQKSAKKRKPADSTIEEGGQAKKKKSAQKKNSNCE